MIDILISIVLALIMFGIGLSLTFQNFKNIFSQPKAIITGLSLQMLALPVLAILFGNFSNLSPELKVGLLILSVCPGGTTSNFITYLLDGDTALSIAMTTINSIFTLFSIPFIINFGLVFFLGKSTPFHLPYMKTILQIFFITIIPATIGIIVNIKLPKIANKLNSKITISHRFFRKIKFNAIKSVTIILLAIVFAIKLLASENAGGAGLTQKDFIKLFPIELIFNITGLFLGFAIATLLKFKKNTATTIAIEVGLQNTTLAFLIAGTLLKNTEMQKPALVYAFFSFWTTIIFGVIIKYFKKTSKK